MFQRVPLLIITCILGVLFSCKKEKSATPTAIPPAAGNGIYADSVFYVQNANDYFISPIISTQGSFASFPDGLNIDQNTGIINVNKSETGLKYKISFTPAGSADTVVSHIIISGINYQDKIYNLSLGDSIAAPIYNANLNMALPGANNNAFDESAGCKNVGIVVGSSSGVINLAQTVRNQGIDTGATAQVKLGYRISDNSNKALNGLLVKIYFYRTAAEIPQYLTDLLIERKGTILTSNSISPGLVQLNRLTINSLASNSKTAKPARPRPPCIIVVSR
ncbi:MAG: hypothetical protein M3O71_23015 [Bacteroidota bacterium]|nr:hypothetical protein [Bacteroidota bacterium]